MLSVDELSSTQNPIYLVIRDLIQRLNSVPPESRDELLRTLSRGQLIVWGTFLVEGEVNNGGFNQFFWNSSRGDVRLAREAYEALGATEFLELLDEAVERRDAATERLGPYAERGTLEAFSDSYSEAVFDDLDRRFLGLDSAPRLIEYIRNHVEEFVR